MGMELPPMPLPPPKKPLIDTGVGEYIYGMSGEPVAISYNKTFKELNAPRVLNCKNCAGNSFTNNKCQYCGTQY